MELEGVDDSPVSFDCEGSIVDGSSVVNNAIVLC